MTTTYSFDVAARADAGLQAATAAFNEENSVALKPAEYLAQRLDELLKAYADAHNVGIITPYAFVERFTPDEYAAIVKYAPSDPHVAGLLARLKEVDQVHLFSAEVQGGVAYLSATPAAAPLLTAERAAAILTL
jgi:hypothetical protein